MILEIFWTSAERWTRDSWEKTWQRSFSILRTKGIWCHITIQRDDQGRLGVFLDKNYQEEVSCSHDLFKEATRKKVHEISRALCGEVLYMVTRYAGKVQDGEAKASCLRSLYDEADLANSSHHTMNFHGLRTCFHIIHLKIPLRGWGFYMWIPIVQEEDVSNHPKREDWCVSSDSQPYVWIVWHQFIYCTEETCVNTMCVMSQNLGTPPNTQLKPFDSFWKDDSLDLFGRLLSSQN